MRPGECGGRVLARLLLGATKPRFRLNFLTPTRARLRVREGWKCQHRVRGEPAYAFRFG